ncbi:WD40 repeat-like protein [Ganoderma leucocontextum]|nr:WD40 repeat-like protein [Ganoderma leucocontextum]
MVLLESSPLHWVHLGSFTWHMPLEYSPDPSFKSSINHFINIFKDFRPQKLREVTVDICFGPFADLVATRLLHSASSELRAELETTLLTFPQPTLSFSPSYLLNVRRHHSWRETLEKSFPMLARRHALIINVVQSSGKSGHDGVISTAIVISADSRWAATGSGDGTIITWDTENGCIVREWSAHADSEVQSLSLPPDSRYLLSAASSGRSIVWDLNHDPRDGAISLTDSEDVNMEASTRRAWSAAKGSWIASGSRDGTVHLWDAHTFQRLHPHETWKGSLLAFSPDGRWIVTTASESDPTSMVRTHCHVWNVESGKPHRELRGHADRIGAAAFDPGSTRIVTGSDDATMRIWDVETGTELLVLKDHVITNIRFVAYSPDGKLVLSSSSTESDAIDHTGGVKVWDASTGALLARLARNLGRFSPPYPACVSPCGRYVASASEENGEVFLWRTSDWSCVAKASGGTHRAQVALLAISPDGRVLCCGAADGTVFFRRMCDLVSAEQYP